MAVGQAVLEGTQFDQSQQLGNQSGTVVLDLTKGNEIELTAIGNISFANPAGNLPAQPNKAGFFTLALTQGGPTGSLYTYSFTGSQWVAPTELSFGTVSGNTDIVLCQLLSNGTMRVLQVFNSQLNDTQVATNAVYNTNAAVASATLSAANVTGGYNEVTLNLTGTLTGAANAQLPTVAALVAAIPDAVVGQSYKLRIINSSSGNFAWTVTTNTGWTLGGTMSIAQNTWRDFYVTLNTLTAATLQQTGTGTNS